MKMRTYTAMFLGAAVVGLAVWSLLGSARGASARDRAPERSAPDGALRPPDGFQWFFTLHGPVSGDAGTDLSVDSDGNVFIAGHHGGLDLDRDGTLDVESRATAYRGATNPLFMKLSRGPSDGGVTLRWTRSPGTPADSKSAVVAADGQGGVYAAGRFQGSVSFEGGPSLTSRGGWDSFLARYDADGAVIWARVFGGFGADGIHSIETDAAGNAYVVGGGRGTFPLDDRGAEFRASGEIASVVVSYRPDGVVRWMRMIESGARATRAVIGPDGGLVMAGEFERAADLDGDGVTDLPAPADRDGFIARLDADGGLLGAWSVPSGSLPAFVENGDLVLLGPLGGPAEERYGIPDFDGDGEADVELKDDGPTGAWVARYSPDGALRWVRSYAMERPTDLVVRGDRIVMTGGYHGVRDLDEDGIPERVDRTVDPSLESELAILLLSAEDGRPERVFTAPGPGRDIAHAAVFLPHEPALYVTGYLQLTADFTGDGEDGEGWAECDDLSDLFFARYGLGGEEPVERTEIRLSTSLYEVPGEGPAADLTWSGASSSDVDVYRDGARITTTANDGAHTDVVGRGGRPPFEYRVCESGTDVCSNRSTAAF